MNKLIPLALLVLCVACSNDDDNFGELVNEFAPETALLTSEPPGNARQVFNDIVNRINGMETPRVGFTVDHGENAEMIGQSLRPARVVYFGNPDVGTRMMQQNRLAGLDLPLRMMVYENERGRTTVAYRNATYLTRTYDLELPERRMVVNDLLADLAGRTDADPFLNISYDDADDIITRRSNLSVSDAVKAAQQRVDELDLRLVRSFDHAQNARSVDLELEPTTLLVFGNATAETQLMDEQLIVGYDLPVKMLIWQEDEETFVSYTNVTTLAERYGIVNRTTAVGDLNDALRQVQRAALGE